MASFYSIRGTSAPSNLVSRYFTQQGVPPHSTVTYTQRNARIGSTFNRKDVWFPTSWSDTAVNITTKHYVKDYEAGIHDTIDRVAGTITKWGLESGYFTTEEAEVFRDELTYILVHQLATFNSPVWYNIGAVGRKQQSSACFLLDVQDSMESILNHYVVEGKIFKGGSGAGVNISKLRAKGEPLSTGGTSSGPISFMKGWDFSAGSIKSGGSTRRAAKMVIMDVDHPDVEEFIWIKVREEEKAQALMRAGFTSGMEGEAYTTVAFQNANNSVMLNNKFMNAVVNDECWWLKRRTDGSGVRSVKAKDIFHQIASAAWSCGDPGILFFDTIQRWHTHPNHGKIITSNPCSEFLHCVYTSCNLSCVNVAKVFELSDPWEALKHIVATLTVAQDILVDSSEYPIEEIKDATLRCRPISIGVTDLGGYLMSHGVAYDSTSARDFGAKLFSTITAHAYLTSTELSARLGTSHGWEDNKEAWVKVLKHHMYTAPAGMWDTWTEVIKSAEEYGIRNGQVTNQMPTGTVSFMLDAVTTGIEPELSLVKTKTLIGGGSVTTVNPLVEAGLYALGYSSDSVVQYKKYIYEHGTFEGSGLPENHIKVFDCAFPDSSGRAIHWRGHVDMMAALQPHISSGISKTVNLPSYATVDDIEECYLYSWKNGLKALAVYRDGSKGTQPVVSGSAEGSGMTGKETRCRTCGSVAFIPTGTCMVCTVCGTQGGCA